MQMRALFLSILVLAGLLAIGGIVTGEEAGEEMCLDLGVIPLDPPDSIEEPRASVEFPHGVHFTYTCATCHHTWDNASVIQGCKTSGCHDLFEAPSKTKSVGTKAELATRYFKNAYHEMCINCHKEIKLSNKKLEASYRTLDKPLPSAGPVSCLGCHPKDE
ncbi:MAG: cytochrome c3 family protein [Deltaproteobacteria bacterium]|nr:cytochrome c3 family protein [Deltaproteobacteria bacterium]